VRALARATTSAADRARKTNVGLFQSAMPADGMLAARSHARISASPRFKGGYAKILADFNGTLYPPIGGVHGRGPRWAIRADWASEE
jgi:hypothetical protein